MKETPKTKRYTMKGRKMGAVERLRLLESSVSERKKLFKELCMHIEAGYSLDCFGAISDITIKEYINKFPEEFVEQELIKSMRKAKQMWESLGVRQSNGTCLGNSRSWYYNMMNRYNWSDKVNSQVEHKGEVAVQVVNYASKARPSNGGEAHNT
jgi:hypothetical protein